ncbi:GIY-YIG nuclease family protein [Clostridium oceanicum]|uniref:GIY-YIG nuclease family protein n=1 Tax=Clostridium oceanicum TaxID=1543 RepID=A0ABN1JUK1_9CLOT
MAYTYILECNDGTLYTGWTTDVKRRVKEHNKGTGAKYTRARIPVELKYFEEFNTNKEAMKRECEIKKLTRKKKIELIERMLI